MRLKKKHPLHGSTALLPCSHDFKSVIQLSFSNKLPDKKYDVLLKRIYQKSWKQTHSQAAQQYETYFERDCFSKYLKKNFSVFECMGANLATMILDDDKMSYTNLLFGKPTLFKIENLRLKPLKIITFMRLRSLQCYAISMYERNCLQFWNPAMRVRLLLQITCIRHIPRSGWRLASIYSFNSFVVVNFFLQIKLPSFS